jgi:hypothetical protein
MGGPPQMNMGMNPGSNQPQQNKPLFPSAAAVCIHSFDMIWIELNTSYSEYKYGAVEWLLLQRSFTVFCLCD